jgi:hypothetical protein
MWMGRPQCDTPLVILGGRWAGRTSLWCSGGISYSKLDTCKFHGISCSWGIGSLLCSKGILIVDLRKKSNGHSKMPAVIKLLFFINFSSGTRRWVPELYPLGITGKLNRKNKSTTNNGLCRVQMSSGRSIP